MLTGVSVVEWTLEIVNDDVEEGNDEKFKLFLGNATNAILGNNDKTQINLIDFEDGKWQRVTRAGKLSHERRSIMFSMLVWFGRRRFVYRCLHGLAPRYLSDYIQRVADSKPPPSSVVVILADSHPTYTAVHRRRSCISGGWKPPLEQSAA